MNTSTFLLAIGLTMAGCGDSNGQPRGKGSTANASAEQDTNTHNPYYSLTDTTKLNVPKSEWRRLLAEDLYHVAFEQGTERPFTGKFKGAKVDGVYRCAVCGNALFDGRTKFDSGTGWPSFYQPKGTGGVLGNTDRALGMVRTEVVCRRCGAHLGHVFDDGPEPTGLRYCINAVSLDLQEKK